MAKSTIGFSIYLNGKLIDEIKVDRPVFNVGKLSTSTLRLDDVNVSRKHAVIELREDGKWRITDLGSTNGTVLRGERIEQAELHDGDRLLIGRTTLVVHIDEAPGEVAAPASAGYAPPATLSGTAGDAQPTAIAIAAMTDAPAPASEGGATQAPAALAPKPRAPAGTRRPVVSGPVSQHTESWAGTRPPAPTQVRGFQLPRGSTGHILTMVGALLFLVGSIALPWQRFELANLELTHMDVNLVGMLMTLLGGSTLLSSIWGFVTGHRHAAARYNLVASLVVIAWMIFAATQLRWGKHLMQYEDVSLQVGFLVAVWGAAVMLGATGVVFGSLPHWDESTSFLRLLLSKDNKPLQDIVVYSPRLVDLAEEAKHPELVSDPTTLAKLPRFHVTREGDTTIALRDTTGKVMLNNRERSVGDFSAKAKRGKGGDRWTPIHLGDRGSVEVGDTRVLFLFVKPVPGRSSVRLTSWTEASSFALLALLAFIALGLYSVIGWEVDAKRSFRPDEHRIAKVDLVITEDKPPEEKPREVQVELPEPEEPKPEVAITEDEKVGDPDNPEEQNQGEEEDEKKTSELVDKLNPRNNEPVDLSKLSPTERTEKAREIAQQTALAQAFREDNPLYAQLMTINPDVDSRVNVLAALDGAGSTFIAGAVDPFGGTLSNGGGFPGGMEGGGLPTGGPNGGGPAVAGVFDRPGGGRNLNDVNFTERPLDPKIQELPPRLTGELDAKTVQQYIRRYLSGIKWCYQDRLQSNRKLGGKLTLAFTILPNGNVMDARAANSTLGDASLEQCIAAKMSRWRFPSPKDGGVVDVAYPLILKTQ
ncbi:MAG: AgmX/PglI C-terminal domain-containing protein [Myxococcota bacterium]